MTKPWSDAGMAQTAEQRRNFVEDDKGQDFKSPDWEEITLALDLSTKTGWAVFARKPGAAPRRVDSGTLYEFKREFKIEYPWKLLERVLAYKDDVAKLIRKHGPDVIVFEETNLGQNRYDQKLLEWLHMAVLANIYACSQTTGLPKLENVKYLSSTIWRSAAGVRLNEADKANNKKLNEIKKMSADTKRRNELKKQYGVRGKITLKHAAVRYANETFKLSLLENQDDEAEALALGMALFAGAKHCNGS